MDKLKRTLIICLAIGFTVNVNTAISMFGYYGNVKLSRYSIPNDVVSAIWRLQLVATDGCPTTNLYFYLEYSGYPVISPHNSSFPENFTPGRLTKTYIKCQIGGSNSNKQEVYMNITSPYAGYWFSASFIDSNDQKVKPDLLRSNCSFYLTPSVSLWQINNTLTVYPNQTVFLSANSIFKFLKYFSVSFNGPLEFELKFNTKNSTNENRICTLIALLRQSAFPDMNLFTNNNDFIMCQQNISTVSSSNFTCRRLSIEYPLTSTWYYLAISSDCDYSIDVYAPDSCSSIDFNEIVITNNQTTVPTSFILDSLFFFRTSKLLPSNDSSTSPLPSPPSPFCSKYAQPIETFRFIGPTYFSVKYYFNSNYNRSNALLVRDDKKPYFIEFLVDLANNGGTLNFYLANNLIYDPGYLASTSTTSTTTQFPIPPTSSQDNKTQSQQPINSSDQQNIQLKNRVVGYDLHNRVKDFNLANVRVMLKACLLFNSMDYSNCPIGYGLSVQSFTNIFTNLQLSVPYPNMGKWYLAIWKECFDLNTNESVSCPTAYVPYTIIQMVSDQCANNYCGDYGTCYIINSQLNLVSACKCAGGYEGYGCSDGKNAIPARLYIASVLFLTISNLIFLLPICLAIYRRWYIESLIYFYNMFFSTFYHACDQEFYSFCIFNYDGLQLADFISSYSSFVITVLSMSAFVRPWKVFTFFVGLLACLTINLYDRFSNIAFIIFLSVSISVTVLTWVKICISKRRLHPSRKQLLKFYLPGVLLAVTGISIYSFLQTKSNYWILHSIWHICMASSIVFFLPKRDKTDLTVSASTPAGDNLKDVTTTASSMSDSSASSSSPQSPQALLHTNATEITLLEQ